MQWAARRRSLAVEREMPFVCVLSAGVPELTAAQALLLCGAARSGESSALRGTCSGEIFTSPFDPSQKTCAPPALDLAEAPVWLARPAMPLLSTDTESTATSRRDCWCLAVSDERLRCLHDRLVDLGASLTKAL
ncbi:hypothetical protein SKAU_G00419070 [Synaphobranchus kaupii]|uniref:Uncharacterized protein n=1 Tax=Synaphobranchus kaupii TaxID=118154 RepID=A0A9Q1E696_SYNKA|nr:hypothetical protein SKAU_G00419070 [Synaphobranchus kaupii]